jgi:hypothetical protein
MTFIKKSTAATIHFRAFFLPLLLPTSKTEKVVIYIKNKFI